VRSACSQPLTVLVGPDGVGKTALAESAAVRLSEAGAFDGGVWALDLAHFPQATAMLSEAVLTVLSATAGRSALVVLDGLTQPELILAIQRQFPRLHLLAVSRLLLPTLGSSDADRITLSPLSLSDGRRLLLAALKQPVDSEQAGAVVRLLEGNPRALRLAAWLLDKFSLSELQARLEVPLLQNLVHGKAPATPISATLEIVRSLLPDAANRLLWALSLLPDGASAEEVAGLAGDDSEGALEALLAPRLIRESAGRWLSSVTLPETERLPLVGPNGARLRLALAFLKAGQLDSAFDLARRVLESCQKSQNRQGFATALLTLGRVTLTDDPARAVLLFEESGNHFASFGDHSGVAEARFWEGQALTALREPEAALAAFYGARRTPALTKLFEVAQKTLAEKGGGELLPVLETDADAVREGGIVAARIQLGLPAK
jgi:tetratricopeptide (TPR) repeat protein